MAVCRIDEKVGGRMSRYVDISPYEKCRIVLHPDDSGLPASELPTVDAVKVDTLQAWLIEIAMNNTGNYLGDACEVIMGRLNGLRQFAKDREVSK